MTIKKIFPTEIYEEENILDKKSLQSLYDYILINGNDIIVTPQELPELATLQNKISEGALTLSKAYNFENVKVSDRFCTHFFPIGKESDMETHSDDLGDYGRKFISFFYLEADQTASGELEFFDPRWTNAPWKEFSQSYKVQPATNKLIIFPVFLWHKVNKYFSPSTPRMALDAVIRVS